MRAPLSIVIPTLNAGDDLPACLAALMEGVSGGLVRELVISDGGSQDATRAIALAAGAVWVEGQAGRGGQLARGVAVSRGDWLLVLHADSRLSPGWAEAVEAGLAQGAPGYFRLTYRASGLGPRLVAGWANLRAGRLGCPFGDQGLLVSRADYEAAGGYREIALMEDMALVRQLSPLRALNATVSTDWARYAAKGWMRQGAANLWRQARFLAGADPNKLARRYHR